MKTILIILMFITITTCGLVNVNDENDISTGIQYDNAIIVTVIDKNEGSSATDTEKSDILKDEDKSAITTEIQYDNTTVIPVIDENERSAVSNEEFIYNEEDNVPNAAFEADVCPSGKDRADGGTCVEKV